MNKVSFSKNKLATFSRLTFLFSLVFIFSLSFINIAEAKDINIGTESTDNINFLGNVSFLNLLNCTGTGAAIKTDASGRLTCGTIAGGITGSGTSNYLPKWTSASALGNSILYDNGTNVGIGLSSPASKLNIYEATGTVYGPSQGGLILDHGNVGGASSIVFRSNVNRGSDHGFIQYQDAATVGAGGESARLIIGTSNDTDDHLVFLPAGNVGIGSVSPTALLDILSKVKITSGGIIYNTDNGRWLDMSGTLSDSLKVSGDLYSTLGELKTDGTGINYMLGSLGLGTSNPSSRLDVYGSLSINGNEILELPSNNPERGPWNPIWSAIGASKPLFGDEEFASGSNSVSVYNNSGGSSVTINRLTGQSGVPNSTGAILRITYDGGTASPGFGGFLLGFNSAANKTYVQRFRAKLPVGRYLVIAENPQGSNSTSYWLTNTAGTGKWEDYIRISHAGNTGTFSSSGHVYVIGGSGAFTWDLSSANVYEVDTPIISSANTWALAQGFNSGAYFPGSGIWNSSGNVGIGTTNPGTFKLNVNGDIATTGIYNTNGSIYLGGNLHIDSKNGNDIYLNYYSAQNTRIYAGSSIPVAIFNTSGNVGIGTTNPTDKLHVIGNATVSGIAGCTGTGSVLKTDASGRLVCGTITGGITGSGSANYVARWATANTLGTGTLYDDGYSVGIGIGSNSPTATLDVRGTIKTNSGFVATDSAESNYAVIGAGIINSDEAGLYNLGDSAIAAYNRNSYQYTYGGGQLIVSGSGSTLGGVASIGSGLELSTSGNRSLSYYGAVGNGYFTQMQTTGTSGYGTYGPVSGDWALYNRFNGASTRGWIWQLSTTNVAGLSGTGNFQVTGNIASLSSAASSFAGPVSVATPSAGTHAATKSYVDSAVSSTWGVNGANIFNSNTGNVGIGVGTTAPLDKFHIKGTLRLEDQTDTTTRDYRLVVDTGGGLNFIDSADSSTKMKIGWNGNVGIGTTGPGAKLDVNGAVYASATGGFANSTYAAGARNPIWRFGNADGYGLSYFQGSAGIGGYDTIGFHFGTATAAGSLLQLNQVGTVVINGNVGIGTASPVSKLHVYGGVYANGTVHAGNGNLEATLSSTEGPSLILRNPSKSATGNYWSIYNMTGGYGDSLQFWSYGSSSSGGRLILSDTGNMNLLGNFNAYNITLQGKDAFNGGDSWLRLNGSNAFTGGIYLGSGITRTDGVFQVGGNGDRFIVSGSLVGIGTTNPTNPLHIRSDSISQVNIEAVSGDNNVFVNLSPSGAGYALLKTGSNQPLSFGVGTNRYLNITSMGRVGIGTTVPAKTLHVYGDTRISSDSDVSTTVGSGALAILNTAGNAGIHIDNNEIQTVGVTDLYIQNDNINPTHINNVVHINTGGNVGIGAGMTNSPYKLAVAGKINSRGLSVSVPHCPFYGFDNAYVSGGANYFQGVFGRASYNTFSAATADGYSQYNGFVGKSGLWVNENTVNNDERMMWSSCSEDLSSVDGEAVITFYNPGILDGASRATVFVPGDKSTVLPFDKAEGSGSPTKYLQRYNSTSPEINGFCGELGLIRATQQMFTVATQNVKTAHYDTATGIWTDDGAAASVSVYTSISCKLP